MTTKTCKMIMSELSEKLKERGWSLYARANGFLKSRQTSEMASLIQKYLVISDEEDDTMIFGFETADGEKISPLVVTSSGNMVQVFLTEMIHRTYAGGDTARCLGLGFISTEEREIARHIELTLERLPNSRIRLIREDDYERVYYYDMLERF